jgi:hypothetical protein
MIDSSSPTKKHFGLSGDIDNIWGLIKQLARFPEETLAMGREIEFLQGVGW